MKRSRLAFASLPKVSFALILGALCAGGCAVGVGEPSEEESRGPVETEQSALLPRDQETANDRRLDCRIDCIEQCTTAACAAECSKKCSRRLPGYTCTMTDNSVNHNLCLAGTAGWTEVCKLECSLIPVAFVQNLCKAGCDFAASHFQACPEATICV